MAEQLCFSILIFPSIVLIEKRGRNLITFTVACGFMRPRGEIHFSSTGVIQLKRLVGRVCVLTSCAQNNGINILNCSYLVSEFPCRRWMVIDSALCPKQTLSRGDQANCWKESGVSTDGYDRMRLLREHRAPGCYFQWESVCGGIMGFVYSG